MNLIDFVNESVASGGLSLSSAHKVEALWNEYKLPTLSTECSIITADFGRLGSVVTRDIQSFDEAEPLLYVSGEYDYVSIVAKATTRILWTDYEQIEPYNRQGGLYCDGTSFEHLGKPIVVTEGYREFYKRVEMTSATSFAVWGFSYNSFYKSVRFGLCIETAKVEEFVSKLRTILNK